ncbi:MAG: DNA polymerase I [Candidatus Babeliales bacterium]
MNEKVVAPHTVFLIDGSSFLYRAYHSLRPLHTSAGVPVNAVYGFCRMIQKLITRFTPTYCAIVWDSKGKTVRHELYELYKATRQEAPSDLFAQKELIKEFIAAIAMAQLEKQAVEADDLMYSAATAYTQHGVPVILVTSDKDMYQTLTNPLIQIFDPFKDTIIGAAQYSAQIGFDVSRLPLYYALLGDASDNIPGVSGIGKKGATDLATQFSSVADLYARINEIEKAKLRENLQTHKTDAILSEKLFLLQYIPLEYRVEQCAFNAQQWAQALPFFKKVEFKSLVQEIEKMRGVVTPTVTLHAPPQYQYRAITTLEQLQELCALIQEKKICAIDTELDGLSPMDATLVGLCLAVEPGTAYYIPCGHVTLEQQLERSVIIAHCKPLFEDARIKKIMHHAKFDLLVLAMQGIQVKGLVDDTLIAAQLITQEWQRAGLKYLSEYYLHEPMPSFRDVVMGKGYKDFSHVPLAQATEYGALDAHQTLRLAPIMHEELQKQQMTDLYQTIEMPLVPLLLAMEQRGIRLESALLHQYSAQAQTVLEQVRAEIIALIGPAWKDINLNSPKQLSELLFEELKLPPQKKTTSRSAYSTDQEVLEQLAPLHPVAQLIVQYRELFKLKSTYLDALPSYVHPRTGRIHTNFSQTAVATGRLASSDPNMQNIPISSTMCPEIRVRAAFKPDPGYLFLSADYSQIELRVLAYLSQDPRLLEAFLHHEDIHNTTAASLFDVAPALVSGEQRQVGKRINFSILYGVTAYGLSKDLKISFGQAKRYIDTYFAQFTHVSAWMEGVIEETKKTGYVTTHWGRRRHIPTIHERNKSLYEAACRVAINTKAQGTAAEIMKLGMINVARALQEQHYDAHMILQIHDELLIAVKEDQAPAVEKLVKQVLESVVQWSVPLEVTTRVGANWDEVSK